MTRPAVFLDKDGTLVENVPYNADPARVTLAPGAGSALTLLLRRGFQLFVISNQPGVSLGYFSVAALTPLSQRIQQLARAEGACVHGFYYCTHAPAHHGQPGCRCRKPAPGLVLQAAAQHGLALGRSWFIGDILDDVEAGHRAGCRSVLIDNGNETEWVKSPLREPDYVARDLLDAASHVAAHQAAQRGRRIREHV
jgi:histidinol-phosphate phosphatase family protein